MAEVPYSDAMRLSFHSDGLPGVIDVEVVVNVDPASLGCADHHLGFPACTATVTYDGGGYRAMFGWVQLVRSTDAATADFAKDPYILFPDEDHPYPFYGYKPTLFDAPGRSHRNDLEWTAHTFLASTPPELGARSVKAVQGFSWGFTIRKGCIELMPTAALTPGAWVEHLPYLTDTYPGWQFEPSFWT